MTEIIASLNNQHTSIIKKIMLLGSNMLLKIHVNKQVDKLNITYENFS